MMSFHHQTEKNIVNRPPSFLNNHRSIDRLIDRHGHRSSTPGPATSPCKSFCDYNAVSNVVYHGTLYSGCILNLAHCTLIPLLLYKTKDFFMDWNGLLHNHETFLHPCVFLQRGLGETVSAFPFVLHHFCSYVMAFCSAALPSNSLIVANQSEQNCTSIDGTTKHPKDR